jgi:phosphate transport system permease protein
VTQIPATQTTVAQTDARPSSLTRKRALISSDRIFWLVCIGAGLLVLAILALILVTTIKNAFPAFQYSGLGFVTDKNWIPNDQDGTGPLEPQFGTLSFIFGTVIVSVVSLIFAVPVSIGIALFLTELAPRRLRTVIITIIDLLAAIPSVVFGLWAIIVVAPFLAHVYAGIHDIVEPIPGLNSLFGTPVVTGRSFMTAGLIVAIMIIPIITSVTREVFATVPRSEKDAALALGATRWEMIKGAVFPHSFGGMVGAVILGLGRAMGETIAIALIIGAANQITANVFASGEALPAIIVRNFGESSGTFRAALIGCGVVLFAMTIIINYGARIIVRRAEIRLKGAAS